MEHSRWHYVRPLHAAFRQIDQIRRGHGALLDSAGWGRHETSYRIVYSEPGVNLRKYVGGSNSRGPVLLIVPAPIKRPYIWDLAPHISVVRRCLDQGMQVYLAEWTDPNSAEQGWGLEKYGDTLIAACINAIRTEADATRIVLAAHSLGGILATTFACLHPENVHALVLLETPLHFGDAAGDFAPLVAAAPDARLIQRTFENVPGSFLTFLSATAAPRSFQWERGIDWSLSMTHPRALDTCIRVERWTYDEFPLPGRLFFDIVELLYRSDRLMKGTLRIGNKVVGPKDLHAPLLNVIDPQSTIIPPQSILPFHDAAASTVKKILNYHGDIGIGIRHVGVLVGANAHNILWPAIFDWLASLENTRRHHS